MLLQVLQVEKDVGSVSLADGLVKNYGVYGDIKGLFV